MSGVHAAARGARARRPPPSRAIRVLQAIFISTRSRSPETTLPAFRAFHFSLLHAKRSYLMAAITTNPRAGWSCWCLYPTQYLFLYAGTFTWCVWPAILLGSTRLAATKGIRKPGRAQTGFKVPPAAARLEDPNKHTTHTSTIFPFGSGRGVRFALRVRPANAPCCDAHVCSQNRFAPQDLSLSSFLIIADAALFMAPRPRDAVDAARGRSGVILRLREASQWGGSRGGSRFV